MHSYSIGFINGHSLRFDIFICNANNEEEAIEKLYSVHGHNFDHAIIDIKQDGEMIYER